MAGPRLGVRRLDAAVIAIGLAALTVGASRAPEPRPPAGRDLTGQLLVATEELRDPRFVHTVIYLTRHDADGAMGLVVNRPVGDVPLPRLLEQFGMENRGVQDSIRVHYGGPVEPSRGFVLHTADYAGEGTRIVRDGVALTAQPKILEAIAAGAGPRRLLFALGYAGWAPGQLEREIQGGYWITVPADEALLFDAEHGRKWERAMARRRIQL